MSLTKRGVYHFVAFVLITTLALGDVSALAATGPTTRGGRLLTETPVVETHVFKGQKARDFIAHKTRRSASYAKAWARIQADAKQKGRTLLDEVIYSQVSVRVDTPVSQSVLSRLFGWLFTTVHAQTYYDPQGEMIVNTYSTGGDDTTEAYMYWLDYGSGVSFQVDDQLQNTTTDYPQLNYNNVLSGPAHDREPIPYDDDIVPASFGRRLSNAIVPTLHAQRTWQGMDCNSTRVAEKMARNAWHDAWPWLVGTAFGCILAGPAWFQCMGAGAVGQLAYRGVQQIQSYLESCG